MLVVGAPVKNHKLSPEHALASGATVIFMENDPDRAAEMRRRFSHGGIDARATVIGGDPRRMLYKLAGPFDVIFCSAAYLSARPLLETLLAPDGELITNDDV
jgi:predicted O-methyltransferase YrrM